MYLKNLTLRGFKSFASATSLTFEPGITCVVGPNGSGKSNVVDALAWVMGEQGAKSLRGGKMEDVIFAGTAGRAPLGRAEVALTIDNTDGALPVEYAEVTISRTMFRNGGSEYAINGRPARLLDVQELLSDSGIGREMHVIVGQGQLDTILQATPEVRRGFVEEAAGVLKHRKRKEKALRKLDACEGNLERLADLLTEIRRQLKPLGRQAEVARKAAVVQAEARDARARLLADDLVQATLALQSEVAGAEALQARRATVEADPRAGAADRGGGGGAAAGGDAAAADGAGDLVRPRRRPRAGHEHHLDRHRAGPPRQRPAGRRPDRAATPTPSRPRPRSSPPRRRSCSPRSPAGRPRSTEATAARTAAEEAHRAEEQRYARARPGRRRPSRGARPPARPGRGPAQPRGGDRRRARPPGDGARRGRASGRAGDARVHRAGVAHRRARRRRAGPGQPARGGGRRVRGGGGPASSAPRVRDGRGPGAGRPGRPRRRARGRAAAQGRRGRAARRGFADDRAARLAARPAPGRAGPRDGRRRRARHRGRRRRRGGAGRRLRRGRAPEGRGPRPRRPAGRRRRKNVP